MIYWNCLDCSLHFRKGRLRRRQCVRCGSLNIMEEEIPKEELILADEIVDEMIRKQYMN